MQPKTKVLRLIGWLGLIVMLVTIFLLSNQPASQSSALSNGIAQQTKPIYEFITNSSVSQSEWNRMLRKLAHVSLFFAFAAFTYILLLLYRVKMSKAILITLLLSVCYAITDELHQLVVVGRGASVRDVLIDSIGIVLAVIAVSIVKRRWFR